MKKEQLFLHGKIYSASDRNYAKIVGSGDAYDGSTRGTGA